MKFKANPSRCAKKILDMLQQPAGATTAPALPPSDGGSPASDPGRSLGKSGVFKNPLGMTAATAALLLGALDVVWRIKLGLPIGFGAGAGQSLTAISGWVSATFFGLITLYVILALLSSCFFFLYAVGYSLCSVGALKTLGGFLWRSTQIVRQAYPRIRFAVSLRTARLIGATQAAQAIDDAFQVRKARWAGPMKRAKGLVRTNSKKAKVTFHERFRIFHTFLAGLTELILGSDDATSGRVLYRRLTLLLGILVVSAALVFGEAERVVTKLENSTECKSIGRQLSLRAWTRDFDVVRCGYLTFKRNFPVAESGLVRTVWQGGQARAATPVFYLGTGREWTVVAPLGNPSARVRLRTSSIEEFYQPPLNPPAPWFAKVGAFRELPRNLYRAVDRTGERWLAHGASVFAQISQPRVQLAPDPLAALTEQLAAQQLTIADLTASVREMAAHGKGGPEIWFLTSYASFAGPTVDRLAAAIDRNGRLILKTSGAKTEVEGLLARSDLLREAKARFGRDAIAACLSPGSIKGYAEFDEGSVIVRNPGAIRNLADTISRAETARSDPSAHILVLLIGSASSTGPQAANRTLAERRADAVRIRLLEALRLSTEGGFENAIHPRLADAGLYVIPVARGESVRKWHDGAVISPRHVEVRICPNIAEAYTADRR